MLRLSNPVRFEKLLWPSFIAKGRSFYVSTSREEEFSGPEVPDDNGLELDEWSQNHFHIFDVFEHDVPLIEKDGEEEFDESHEDFIRAWEITKKLVHVWAAALSEQFPNVEFIVVATRMSGPIIRFFRRRGDALLGPPGKYFATMLANDSGFYLIAGPRNHSPR
jgi:hypothetical protein